MVDGDTEEKESATKLGIREETALIVILQTREVKFLAVVGVTILGVREQTAKKEFCNQER